MEHSDIYWDLLPTMQTLHQEDKCQEMRMKYAYFDGDNIGNSIENLLSRGRVPEATHLSERIKLAIFQIELFVESINSAEIVISGGDDVLIKFDSEKHDYLLLEKVASIFSKNTGLSMSCGVGDNVNQAISSLMSVKQRSKGIIRFFNQDTETQDFSMKPTKLYVFITSNDPDPYINVLAHCASYCKGLQQVNLVSIIEDRGKTESRKEYLNNLKEDIYYQLSSLSSGKYLKIKDKNAKERDERWEQIDIPPESIEFSDCKRYEALRDISLDIKVVVYTDLETEISKWLQSDELFEHLFDVTGVAKNYLVDVYTILRFKNRSSIYSFELIPEPNFSKKYLNLIHNFEYGSTYKFNCLADSFFTRNKLIVDEDSILGEGDMNRLQADFEMLQKYGNDLEETIALNFARSWSLLYFLILLLLFVWSIQLIIRQPDGWNRLEPLIFVATTSWFLMNYLIQVVFTGRVISLDPLQLFSTLKRWKEQRLKRSRLTRANRTL